MVPHKNSFTSTDYYSLMKGLEFSLGRIFAVSNVLPQVRSSMKPFRMSASPFKSMTSGPFGLTAQFINERKGQASLSKDTHLISKSGPERS